LRREASGIALLLLALFATGALAFQPDASGSCFAASGGFGPAGACMKSALIGLLGWPGAVLVPLIPVAYALRLFRPVSDVSQRRSWLLCVAGLSLLLPIAFGIASGADRSVGALDGLWGSFFAYYLTAGFGTVGAWLALLLATSILTAWTLQWNPVRALLVREPRAARVREEDSRRARLHAAASLSLGTDTPGALLLEPPPEEMPAIDAVVPSEARDLLESGEEQPRPERKRREKKSKADVAAEHTERVVAQIAARAEEEGTDGSALPSSELLHAPEYPNADAGERELEAMGAKLMEALRTFRVDGQLVGRTTGPSVTQFEIEPSPGVKVRQFANLSNDLALAMRAPSIRIVAPIPGRGAVGVEVPNPHPEMVYFRELVESREFQHARAALPIALGKDLEGKPVIADLAKMPHLLIAGATGSGKSVCVNTIITSLIYRHTPQTLRFLMVDPKMVELSVYNQLPHLRHKVITDNRDAAAVLKWAVMEMQERYELLAANGCRNVQDFNRRVNDGTELKRPKQPDVAFEDLTYKGGLLPYIVVVIDEMADLMMTVPGEVETPIAMLAQKARAIGIHLLLATQRPSVNVITGLIKANFPSRIAFRVASQVDSRTIIDGGGAEALLGNGDMLFIPPGKSEPSRLQGAYLSSDETETLMTWYREVREARRRALEEKGASAEEQVAEEDILEKVRAHELAEASGPESDGEDGADRDKLFREAAEVVIQHQQGSTSLLQRRLKVGYGRAARIIDQLHGAGILGPPDGSKPREVLMGLEDLDRICGERTASV
jgi:DNA segregation ATPase FtsK/SpoIIIE, S-DNA-T family